MFTTCRGACIPRRWNSWGWRRRWTISARISPHGIRWKSVLLMIACTAGCRRTLRFASSASRRKPSETRTSTAGRAARLSSWMRSLAHCGCGSRTREQDLIRLPSRPTRGWACSVWRNASTASGANCSSTLVPVPAPVLRPASRFHHRPRLTKRTPAFRAFGAEGKRLTRLCRPSRAASSSAALAGIRTPSRIRACSPVHR